MAIVFGVLFDLRCFLCGWVMWLLAFGCGLNLSFAC